jgi:hypothetical protein
MKEYHFSGNTDLAPNGKGITEYGFLPFAWLLFLNPWIPGGLVHSKGCLTSLDGNYPLPKTD